MILVLHYSSSSIHVSSPLLYSSSSTYTALTPTRYRPTCSHYLFFTHVPGIRTVSSQSSKIGRVAMYCVAAFYLFSTYSSISSNPDSCILVSIWGKYQIPYNRLWGCLTVIYCGNLLWNHPRALPVQGVIAHISAPISRTTCTTSLKNHPDTLRLWCHVIYFIYIL